MKITLNTAAFWAACAMSAFAGIVATSGLASFIPGVNVLGVNAVWVMGILFEVGMLVAFAYLHKHWQTISPSLKYGLAVLASIVIVLDIIGVAGQFSQGYQARRHAADAANMVAVTNAAAHIAQAEDAVAELDRQLAAVSEEINKISDAQIRAKDDRDRVKAARALKIEAESRKTALLQKRAEASSVLLAARTEKGAADASAVTGSGEFAAIQFAAQSLGWSEDAVARVIIWILSGLACLFAPCLIAVSGHETTPIKVKAPEKVLTARQIAARKGAETRKRNKALNAKKNVVALKA